MAGVVEAYYPEASEVPGASQAITLLLLITDAAVRRLINPGGERRHFSVAHAPTESAILDAATRLRADTLFGAFGLNEIDVFDLIDPGIGGVG